MQRTRWLSSHALPVVLAALLATTLALSLAPRRADAAAPDAVVRDFVAAINAGDAAAAAALFTEDGVFTDIDGGSFAIVGAAALEYGFSDTSNTQVELTNVTVVGEEVKGTARLTDDNTEAAGVARILQPFTAIVRDDKIVEFHLTYNEGDAQTRTYLEYQAAQEEDEGPLSPDALELILGPGRDGSQTGTAFIFEEGGVAFVGIQIAPGAAGVLQLAHIHVGDCPGVGAITSPLASVLDGFSFTILSMSKAELLAGNFAINVHKSAAEAGLYVSCGEVEAAAAAPTPAASPPAPAATPAPSGSITAPSTGTGSGGDAENGMWLAAFVLAGALLAGTGAVLASVRHTN